MPEPYFSEIKYRGSASGDYAEVVLPVGTDPSAYSVVIYHPNGNLRSTNALGTVQDTVIGLDVYVVNNGIHKNGAVALVENGTVLSFVSFDNTVTPTAGPAAGMTSTHIGSTGNDFTQSLSTTDGVTYTAGPQGQGTIPCFLSGTRISTETGERPVEALRPGDRVLLADGGAARLLWTGSVVVSARGRRFASRAPVRIPRDTFGPGRPRRDLFVSPHHRVRLSQPAFEVYFESHQVLIPAKHLVGWMGIEQCSDIPTPRYHHLLFDRHEVVLSEGLPTESFHPTIGITGHFPSAAQSELLDLFPRLDLFVTAARCLRGYEAKVARLALAG